MQHAKKVMSNGRASEFCSVAIGFSFQIGNLRCRLKNFTRGMFGGLSENDFWAITS